jgi:hypothetical protein
MKGIGVTGEEDRGGSRKRVRKTERKTENMKEGRRHEGRKEAGCKEHA